MRRTAHNKYLASYLFNDKRNRQEAAIQEAAGRYLPPSTNMPIEDALDAIDDLSPAVFDRNRQYYRRLRRIRSQSSKKT